MHVRDLICLHNRNALGVFYLLCVLYVWILNLYVVLGMIHVKKLKAVKEAQTINGLFCAWCTLYTPTYMCRFVLFAMEMLFRLCDISCQWIFEMPLTWNERKYKTIRRNAPSSYYVEEFAVWMTREGVDEVFVLFYKWVRQLVRERKQGAKVSILHL